MGQVRSKRMFGGVGLYINELFCAIIVDDCLYFKGDEWVFPCILKMLR